MLYRPLSFTRNLGGPQKVYDAIRQAYRPGISLREFRAGLAPQMSRDQSLIITEFFIASEIRNRKEIVFEDQLVRSCRETALNVTHLRLALFALNLNLPGQRMHAVHRSPAPAQNAYVRQFLFRDGAWQTAAYDRGAMREWLSTRLDQLPDGITKFRNNYHYLFAQCGFQPRPDGTIETFAEEWYRPALRLYFERRRLMAPQPAEAPQALLQAAQADELNRLLGISRDWLAGRLPEQIDAFLADRAIEVPAYEPVAPEVIGPPDRRLVQVTRIERDTEAVRALKALYGYRCQVCGIRLRLDRTTFFAEGAHIRPLGRPHNGPDVTENILVLCPNHHVEIESGVLSISPEDGITIHHAFEDNTVHERPLTLMPGHVLGREYLRYHWERLYMPNRPQD